MKKLLAIILCLLLPIQSFAASSNYFQRLLIEFPILKISEEKEAEIQGLLTRNFLTIKGPMKCPLRLSGNISALGKLSFKMNKLKQLCLKKGDGLVDGSLDFNEMMSSAGDLEAGAGATAGIGALGSIMGGLGALSNRSCIKGSGTLDVFLSIVTTLMTFSGFIPGTNGTAISGASAGLLSTLLLIKGMTARAYNFDDIVQRKNFINLSCSFFELRQELNASGLLNIPTPRLRLDCGLNVELIDYLENLKEENRTQLVKIEENLKEHLYNRYERELGVALDLEELLEGNYSIVNNSIMNDESLPPGSMKLKVINQLSLIAPALKEKLNEYMDADFPSMRIFDNMLIKELNKLDYVENPQDFEVLIDQDPSEFDKGYRSNLLFHFERILSDIKKMKIEIKEDWILEMGKEDQTFAEGVEERNHETRKYIAYLDARKKLLGKLSNSCEASLGLDADLFGKAALIDIMANFNCLKSNIAASTAFQFVGFATKSASLKYKIFNHNFKWFEDNLLRYNVGANQYEFKVDPTKLNMMKKMQACQKGVDARAGWIDATGNVDQTVGYVKSISDLLVLPDKTLYSRKPEHERRDGLMTKGEKLRRHQQSIYYAEQILKGKEVDRKKTKRIMAKNYAGVLMLEKHRSRKKMEGIQMVMSNMSCDNMGTSFGGDGDFDLGDIDIDPNDVELGGDLGTGSGSGVGIGIDF